MTERDIFLAALDINCATDRAAYVAQACADDPALRERLGAMLAFHERDDSFLRAPCAETRTLPNDATIVEGEGSIIGRYKLLEKIGEGGFAIVFMAEQTEPIRRRVALKVIKPGMDSKQVIGRFEAERQALALMDHPNIAKVFDGGVTDSGRPYFVMELVNGVPLTDYCDTFRLDTNQRLAVFAQICRAVQHAHQKGVIHRDLKPSNVLVTLHDDTPVCKVIDFGIAKATQQRLNERTVFTRFQHFIGTPAYMSPEQATFSGLDIDTRSDIYSLGVLLYELLTGVTPFDKQKLSNAAYDELCRIIRDDQPPAPSTRISTLGEQLKLVAQNRRADTRKLQHAVHGELDWIVMKALEKERSRRYETASAMADDIERFLHHEPVLAGPPGTMYRLRKAIERNRGKVAAVAAISLALLLGTVVSSAGLVFAVRSRNDALEAKSAADKARADEATARRAALLEVQRKQRLLYVGDTSNAKQAWDAGNVDYAVELLKRHIPKAGEADLRTFAWHHMWDQCHQYEATFAHEAPLHAIAYSPDGQVVAAAGEGGLVVLRDSASRKRLHSLPVAIETAMTLCFSPSGHTLAIGGGTSDTPRQSPGSIELWDWKRRVRLRTLPADASRVACLAFTADGARLACSNYRGVLQIWELDDGDDKPDLTIEQPEQLTFSIAFSPDGQTLAAGGWSEGGAKAVRFWDARTAQELQTVELNERVRCLAYSPDGQYLAAGTMTAKGSVNLVDIASQTVRTLAAEDCVAETLAFSSDSRTLVAGNWKGSIQLFEVPSGKLTTTLKGHSGVVPGISLSPDGRTLATCSHDRTIKLWDLAAAAPPETLTIGHDSDAPWMRFSHDSKLLATSSFSVIGRKPQGTLRLWDVASGRLIETCREGPGLARYIAFSPGGDLLAWSDSDSGGAAGGAGTITVRELETGRRQSLDGFGAEPLQINFSTEGRTLTAIGYLPSTTQSGKHALIATTWNHETGTRLNQQALASVELTPAALPEPPGFPRFRHAHIGPDFFTRLSHDGKFLARGHGGSVRLWNLETGHMRTLDRHSEFVTYIAFSATGEILASCSQDKSICLWNTRTGELIQTLIGRTWPLTLALSPDGATLATGDLDGKVTLCDLRTFTEIIALDAEADVVNGLAFAPDGQALACGTLTSGRIHVWRAPRK